MLFLNFLDLLDGDDLSIGSICERTRLLLNSPLFFEIVVVWMETTIIYCSESILISWRRTFLLLLGVKHCLSSTLLRIEAVLWIFIEVNTSISRPPFLGTCISLSIWINSEGLLIPGIVSQL